MSNVEHPQHYRLSIDLEVLDVINLVLSNQEIYVSDSFYLGNVIKYLFRAEQKNGLEDYKKALYYLKKIMDDKVCPNYTDTEKMLIKKILKTVENKKIRNIIDEIIFLDIRSAQHLLQDYIEEQEKQNDKED